MHYGSHPSMEVQPRANENTTGLTQTRVAGLPHQQLIFGTFAQGSVDKNATRRGTSRGRFLLFWFWDAENDCFS